MLLIPFRFVLAGTAGISCAGMQSEMVLPLIPPQVKFRPISGCFVRSGQFRPILGGMGISAGIGFALKKKKKKIYPATTLFYISNQMFTDPFTRVKLLF